MLMLEKVLTRDPHVKRANSHNQGWYDQWNDDTFEHLQEQTASKFDIHCFSFGIFIFSAYSEDDT